MDSRGGKGHALQPEVESDDGLQVAGRVAPAPVTVHQVPERKGSLRHSHPKPPPTPNTGIPPNMAQSVPNPLIPSAPASPPTPAPSPTPHQRTNAWSQSAAAEVDNTVLQDFRLVFSRLDLTTKEAWLEDIVESCDSQVLSILHRLVSPRLKKDPFSVFPNEICFRVKRYPLVVHNQADPSRYSNSLMTREPLSEHRKCLVGGAKCSVTTRHGKRYARSMRTGACPATRCRPVARSHPLIFHTSTNYLIHLPKLRSIAFPPTKLHNSRQNL